MHILAMVFAGWGCLKSLYQWVVAFANVFSLQKKTLVHEGAHLPTISVLVPIRNEAHQLAELLENLAVLAAPVCEVLVFDDASTDSTSHWIQAQTKEQEQFRFFRIDQLPPGWLGKNHACWQMAQQARGEWLLFVDADVRMTPALPAQALHFALRQQLQLLSLFPQQQYGSWGEAFWVPLVNQMLLSGIYLPWISSSKWPAWAAANGQFMLFNKEAYMQIGGHKAMAHQLPEDVLLARRMKSKGGRVGVLAGCSDVTCRMYPSGRAAYLGLMRNVVPGFGGSLSTFIWGMAEIGATVSLLFFAPHWMRWGLLLPVLSRIFVLCAVEKRPLQQLVLLIPQLLFWPFLWIAACYAHQTQQIRWKDRPIS